MKLFALLGLVLLCGGTAHISAFGSNEGEGPAATATPTPAPEATGSGGTADVPDPEAPAATDSAPAPTPKPTPQPTPTPGQPDGQPASGSGAPGASQAPRPELPAIPEGSELETVREGSGPIAPAVAAAPVTPATLALLRALETRHASVVTVRGSFDQLKVSEIFLEEIRSKGTFWYQKPDLFRCDYEPPDEMTNLILKDAIYVYVPELEQCEVYRFSSDQERDQQLHSMVLGFGFKTDDLLEAYSIVSSEDEGPARDELTQAARKPAEAALLHLKPLPGLEDTSPFTNLKLWIDKGSLLPEKVSFEDYNGDKTTIDLRSVDLNVAVDAKKFVPSFPAGTEYIDKSDAASGD